MSWKKHVGKKVYELLVPKVAKNLTERRKTFETMVEAVDKHTKSPNASKLKKEATAKGSKIHDRYEKARSDRHKAHKKLVRKTVGAGAAAVTGIVGAHAAAKHKFPKYKKFMEQDIAIKDGKLKLVPKKKK